MMETEQQVRLNFLEEAEAFLDSLESVLLQLSTVAVEIKQLDLALRAAHSLKGGASMMGFNILSQVAHRLEDFLKIIRVRHQHQLLKVEIETLLLQGLDALRQISEFHQQGQEINPIWLEKNVDPIFDQLTEYLGELQSEDEDALLSQEEEVNPALLMFENGVETLLEQLETQLTLLEPEQLYDELMSISEQLIEFGLMAEVNSFINLSQSVKEQLSLITIEEVFSFAKEALETWQRSHALIILGRLDNLPTILDFSPNSSVELNLLDELQGLENLENDPLKDISFSELASSMLGEETFNDLQEAFTQAIEEQKESSEESENSQNQSNIKQNQRNFRISGQQISAFNRLFEDLILERNSINFRVDQLKNFMTLMWQRMQSLEDSNTLLRRWYDAVSLNYKLPQLVNHSPQPVVANVTLSSFKTNLKENFDVMEMAQYTDLHLISQEQMETIVQLREVATDIDLGFKELTQSVSEFNQTTHFLYDNLIRSQMRPFGEITQRFPRVIRDLSVQFNKTVKLQLKGETTLIDSSVLNHINDPLIHLLRNAFDHGIEDKKTRLEAGKIIEGTITIEANNRGNQTIITVSDDGQGIDLSKISSRLISQGMSKEQVELLSEKELLNQIFEPGFSTAEKISELSGRGVGMDIVKTNLTEVRGEIAVNSKLGLGTTFTLTVPINLSVLRVMIVESKGMVFAIAADSIKGVIQHHPEENTVMWGDKLIPVLNLPEKFHFSRPNKPFTMTGTPMINRSIALIIEDGNTLRGVSVDRFWVEEDMTVRPIATPIPLPPGFNQSIIWGDGRVIPLIDLAEWVNSFDNHAQTINTIEDNSVVVEQTSTILIVDDSINVRRYLMIMLNKAGYQVEEAKDGQEAVDKLFNGLQVNAVISDLEMPRLDGYGVLEMVKQDTRFEQLPIIILTSRSQEKHRKLAMNLGASAYFSKPYTEQKLLDTLEELLMN
ncbi:two-component hybrid sensor and regulator [Crocosphaera subtropica ATCC 51142]|uniref:histidine kinase n=1 Tax=Crocosphaera subtropica (strain ATCC 51142 / BH68) TaxID=43989 RepID=B1WR09_CROS5|nr:hybrid sensor histidine kinase/response regulator [Crocosphaera subtropica]ACB50067.1 two-component hybrid sensor and regulator [Crocosphaera subtropica ATCC 51142]